MRSTNKKSVPARNSDALEPKPMRLVGTEGFDVLDDRPVKTVAQAAGGVL